jgi:3-hydroxyacyl-CoA dehydrogenase
MTGPVTLTAHEAIAVIEIDNPPVNTIDAAVTAGLNEALTQFEADRSLQGLIIKGAARTFVAGGDLAEFEQPGFSAAPFNKVLSRIEALDRPAIAVMHGTVLGGGLELALACHARIATTDTVFGMPEITLGLIPGSLGTQRLPRLIGLEAAAEMILSGKPIETDRALTLGLIEATALDPQQKAISYITRLGVKGIRRLSQMSLPDCEAEEDILREIRTTAAKTPWLPSGRAASEALEAAARVPFPEGEKIEATLFAKLVKSSESRAMRHVFKAERTARQIPDLSAASVGLRGVKKIGVLGIGTMGAGISMAFANAGYSVRMVEATLENLERGEAIIAKTYAAAVKKGRLTSDAAEACLARLTGTTEMTDLQDVDLVIEAVFEDMDLKLSVSEKLGKIVRPGCIIATNTSTLDVDKIAAASGRPADVIGTHFFSPAHIMKLLEIVRGAETDLSVLQTLTKIAVAIGKIPVVSGVCYGFIGNRMAEVYMRENEALQLEGATPSQIDGVLEDPRHLGMAMGPNRMLDMAGVDVGARTVIEWIKSGDGPQDPAYRALCRAMYDQGLHGQKTEVGYFRYDGRNHLPSPEHEALRKKVADTHGVVQRSDISEDEILERLLYSMVNEAAFILEEGIAYRGSDIDVVWTAGYGFPKWRGGPLFMADEIGLKKIVSRIEDFAAKTGGDVWAVSPLLKRLAETGGRLSDWFPTPSDSMKHDRTSS